ncbi:MAG: FAD-dependent oxidoreductase, partial [Halobacteriaceae archaeon]
MGLTTEVAVIGGGATGCGIARDLALRNIDVVLVERKSLNAGTTGRSHCVLHSGARYAETDPQGAINCFQENQIIRQIAPHCIDQTGGYFIQLQQDSTSYFHEKLSACKDINIEAHAIDPDTMSFSNVLSNSISSVFAVPDGVIYPAHLIAATAVSAKQAGTRILTNAPVTDLQRDHHQITGVEVAHQIDTITADVV